MKLLTLASFFRSRPWQDWVFTVGGMIFDVSLWETLISPSSHVPLLTSLPTSLALYVFGFTQGSLGLRMTAVMTCITATEWAAISFLRQ